MTELQKAEVVMVTAQTKANRAMREASCHINDRNLWDIWQQEERFWHEARERWLVLKNKQESLNEKSLHIESFN